MSEALDEVAVRSTMRRKVNGSHLRDARQARALTQEDLAKLLDVRLATVSDRENSPKVSWETWLATAMALELPVDWKPGDAVPPKTT